MPIDVQGDRPGRSGAGDWRVCLPTVDETTVSLAVPDPGAERAPWLLARALDLIRATHRAEPADAPRRFVAGRRRGAPMVAGETVRWAGVPLTVAAVQSVGAATGELTLHLPPWDQLAPIVPEALLWGLVDSLADDLRAPCGIVADGRAIGFPDLEQPRRTMRRLWRQHLGLLLPPEWQEHLGAPSVVPYTQLESVGLLLVLR